MITRDADAFFRFEGGLSFDASKAEPRGVFLVSPQDFSLAAQSAQDNHYMRMQDAVDAQRAADQHRALADALSEELPVQVFPGDADTPDAIFPNNVFATAPGRFIIGHMRHEVRQREARREDVAAWFQQQGRECLDLRQQAGICELTGSLVIDRARSIGFIGLSERCDEAGALAMHQAFGLRATLMFDLAPGEYHTNVVLAVLMGRTAIIAPTGFADADIAQAIAAFYGPHAVVLDPAGKQAFIANAISLRSDSVWMSARADAALSPAERGNLQTSGFRVRSVELGEIEKAGGSLRCCVGEVF